MLGSQIIENILIQIKLYRDDVADNDADHVFSLWFCTNSQLLFLFLFTSIYLEISNLFTTHRTVMFLIRYVTHLFPIIGTVSLVSVQQG